MANLRPLLMIGASLLTAVVATVVALRWIDQQTQTSTGRVAVAAVDLDLGQELGADQIKLVPWPAGSVPAGAFDDAKALAGRVTRGPITKDEPLLEGKLAPVGTKGGLSAVIAEGKRAITVRVNDVVGVAGFALPGNFVDVIVNMRDDREREQEHFVSKIVLEKILVLAVAQEASRDATKPKVVNAVTIEVTPGEAEKLDLARSIGTLSLVLRNQVDTAATRTTGVTKDDLLDRPRAKAPAPAPSPAQVRTVTVTRTVEVPAPIQKPAAAQRCVESWVGSERRLDCF